MTTHVVWDWNGTLFDDQHLVVEGLNAVLDHAGLPRVDVATYQRLYTRPVRVFYERVFGRAIPDDEWVELDDTYHHGYREALHAAGLAHDAEVALDLAASGARAQSLLSMWRHDELVPLVTELGIRDRFARIDGLRGAGGGLKAPHLTAHLQALGTSDGQGAASGRQGPAPADVVVIGDALDDAAAAAHVGARCVLFDGGSHARGELELADVPVAASLTEAVEMALDASDRP